MKVFVDTSAWIAHFNRQDDFHQKAREVFKKKPDLLTSNAVFHETIAHLSVRVSKKAAKVAGDFICSSVVELIPLSEEEEISSWQRLKKSKFSISFVDMTTVILMERLNLKEIFAFDRDFLKMGFKVIPSLEKDGG